MPVLSAGERREQTVIGHHLRQLPLQQNPAIERTHAADHGRHRQQQSPPATPKLSGRIGKRSIRSLQYLRRHDPHHHGAGHCGQHRRDTGAQQGGAGDIATRVFHLGRSNRGAFQADHRPQRQRGGTAGSRQQGLIGGIEGLKMIRCHEPQPPQAQRQQRQQFQQGHHQLHQAGGAQSAQVDHREQPEHSDGQPRAQCPRLADRRDEHAQITDQRDGNGTVGYPDGDPIAPGHQKAGEVTKGHPRVGVDATRRRFTAGQPGKGQRQQHRATGGEQPAQQADAAKGTHRGWQQKDAGADHVAHHQGGRHRR